MLKHIKIGSVSIISASILGGLFWGYSMHKKERPNVLFILTDDQGYGDMACHGNPWIQTPNIDKLHDQSIRFTNFHVGTTCAPSRSGLMTGKYCNEVGVWHTVNGREILATGEITLAEGFKKAGYHTAIFGKWHLGDNYPFRPQDRGFDEVLVHGGGGVGQQPDYWNNDYFDDTYFRNGKPEKFEGYCTDIWFSEALKFIEKNKKHPFFCYLAVNAPHSPYHVAEKYSSLYKNNQNIPHPDFYGMITNLDENMGRLREALTRLGIEKNTIFVFMTDNGTSGGVKFGKDNEVLSGYNANMRGIKGSPYDGGHRVPFFVYWPDGNISRGKDIADITSYVDFMPTMLDLCGIEINNINFDGTSLKPLIYNGNKNWPERILFTDTQREERLEKWKEFAVMTNHWRLVGRDELYDMTTDSGQKSNVATQYPEVVEELTTAYEKWWNKVSVKANEYQYEKIGSGEENPVRLNCHDSHVENGLPAWSQLMVRNGEGAIGFWAVQAEQSGMYQVELYRWPKEAHLRLNDPAPADDAIPGGDDYPGGKALRIKTACLKIGNHLLEKSVSSEDSCANFQVTLEKGTYQIECRFVDDQKVERDAYYVYVNFMKEDNK